MRLLKIPNSGDPPPPKRLRFQRRGKSLSDRRKRRRRGSSKTSKHPPQLHFTFHPASRNSHLTIGFLPLAIFAFCRTAPHGSRLQMLITELLLSAILFIHQGTLVVILQRLKGATHGVR
jgi:hypothetical protein